MVFSGFKTMFLYTCMRFIGDLLYIVNILTTNGIDVIETKNT